MSGDAIQEFVRSLRKRMAHVVQTTPLPDPDTTALREVTPADDAHERFRSEAAAAGCRVHPAEESSWLGVVAGILREHQARRVLIEAQAGTALTVERAAALRDALAPADIATTMERDDETMFGVDAAVTGVVAAVAETGTIVCTSGQSSARGASLIPPVHVALVGTSQIVPDLFDYFERLGPPAGLPANINLITGPSKTADIEGILVTGVHGPGHVHIVLLSSPT